MAENTASFEGGASPRLKRPLEQPETHERYTEPPHKRKKSTHDEDTSPASPAASLSEASSCTIRGDSEDPENECRGGEEESAHRRDAARHGNQAPPDQTARNHDIYTDNIDARPDAANIRELIRLAGLITPGHFQYTPPSDDDTAAEREVKRRVLKKPVEQESSINTPSWIVWRNDETNEERHVERDTRQKEEAADKTARQNTSADGPCIDPYYDDGLEQYQREMTCQGCNFPLPDSDDEAL